MFRNQPWMGKQPLLLGGIPTKNDGRIVSWDDEIPNQMESHSKFHGSKPPTRYLINHY